MDWNWGNTHSGTHLIGEGLVALAHLTIPLALIYLSYKRRDLPFRWMFLLVGLLVLVIGFFYTGHVLAIWQGNRSLGILITWMMVLFSVATAAAVWTYLPKALELPNVVDLKAAQETEIRFRKLVELLPDSVLLIDRMAKVLMVNDRMKTLFGYGKDEIVGRNAGQLIADEDQPDYAQQVARFYSDEAPGSSAIEVCGRRKDGSTFPMEIIFSSAVLDGETYVMNAVRDVTDRKKAQEALNQSDRHFRALIENALDIITVLNGDGVIRYQSPSVGRVLGYDASDLIGKNAFDFVHPEDRRFVTKIFSRGLQFPSQSRSIEIRVKASDGVWRTLECTGKNLLEDPVVKGVVVNSHDVTDRKRGEDRLKHSQDELEKRIEERTDELARTNRNLCDVIAEHERTEEALRESQHNYLTLVNSIDAIVWEADAKTHRFSFLSEQAVKLLGYDAREWLDEPWFWKDHIHGLDREDALRFKAHAVAEKKDGQCEYRMITADGRSVWFRDITSVVVQGGEAVKLRGVLVDITERKEIENALERERNFAAAVVDTASALVFVLDTEARIYRMSRATERMTGYSLDEIKGKPFWDVFLPPSDVTDLKLIFARLRAGQFPINHESRLVTKDGGWLEIAWSSTVLTTGSNAVHFIITGIDITKRKQADENLMRAVSDLERSNRELDKFSRELQSANERLQKMDEIKSTFFSTASHELRTPLTSIKGYVSLILQGKVGGINEKQKEFLGYVKESTDRLHRLLNELLDISRIESGQVPMRFEATDVSKLVQEEVMVFKAQSDEKNIQFELQTEALREVVCDPDKIKQVVDNLLSNAIKYTPRGGRVRILGRNVPDGIELVVQDTGIGIPQNDISRVFEPFQHLNRSGIDAEESTGLGLTLVKRIVEAHSGRVLAASEGEGRGTAFTVFLPQSSEKGYGEKNFSG